jgi:hypothetical protein
LLHGCAAAGTCNFAAAAANGGDELLLLLLLLISIGLTGARGRD